VPKSGTEVRGEGHWGPNLRRRAALRSTRIGVFLRGGPSLSKALPPYQGDKQAFEGVYVMNAGGGMVEYLIFRW
jgi:hypothetical protein